MLPGLRGDDDEIELCCVVHLFTILKADFEVEPLFDGLSSGRKGVAEGGDFELVEMLANRLQMMTPHAATADEANLVLLTHVIVLRFGWAISMRLAAYADVRTGDSEARQWRSANSALPSSSTSSVCEPHSSTGRFPLPKNTHFCPELTK